MLTDYFYEGSRASTTEGYRERLEFCTTLARVSGGALMVMLGVFAWSATTLFPLADTHPALATAILAIKTAGVAVIAATATALVAALRGRRRAAAGLAAVGGR